MGGIQPHVMLRFAYDSMSAKKPTIYTRILARGQAEVEGPEGKPQRTELPTIVSSLPIFVTLGRNNFFVAAR